MRWFRFYEDVLGDPKVQRLPPEVFRAWVNLLCIASKRDGDLPEAIEDLAFEWRCSVKQAEVQLNDLIGNGLVDREPTLRPHNWNGRQFKSDDSRNRVKKFRERQCNGDKTVTVTASVTAPETFSNATEQSRVEKKDIRKIIASSIPRATRASRANTDDPAVRKQVWEQRMINEVVAAFGIDEGARIVEAYGAGDPAAKQIFNSLSDGKKLAALEANNPMPAFLRKGA